MVDASVSLYAKFEVANASADLLCRFEISTYTNDLFAYFVLKTGDADVFAKFEIRYLSSDLFSEMTIRNINTDWAFDVRADLLRVYYIGTGTPIWSSRMLYSFAQDTYDQQEYMDDPVPMSAATPEAFTMINGYHISDIDTQYLTAGAISTDGWINEIRVLKFAAAAYLRPFLSSIGKPVTGSATGDTGTLLAFNNEGLLVGGADARKWWIRMDDSGDLFDQTENVSVGGGTGFGALVQQGTAWSRTGENLYTNLYTLGTLEAGTQSYIYQGYNEIDYWWSTGFIDVLIKCREMGVLLPEAGPNWEGGDAGYVIVFGREYGDLYDWFQVDLSSGGRQAVPLATFADPDNTTVIATVADYGPRNSAGGAAFTGLNVGWVNGSLPFTGASGQDIVETNPATWWVIRGGTNGFTAYVLGGDTGASGNLILGNRLGTPLNGETIDVCKKIGFDALTSEFTVGQVVSGSGSGATATIRRIDFLSGGVEGILHVGPTVAGGPFVDGDNLTDPLGGAAVMNGNQADNTYTSTSGTLNTAVVTIDKDILDGSGDQPYNAVIDMNGEYMDNMYEYAKAIMQRDSAFQCFPHDEINATEPYQTGEEYIRCDVDYTPVKSRPLGAFAGGVFFGARGVFVEDMHPDDVRNYQLIDANGVTRDPPNLQSYIVSGLVVGDRVAIFPTTGDNVIINKSQYSLVDQVQGVGFIRIQEAIPSDTPTTGVIRVVETASEQEDIYDYTSFDTVTKTFYISGVTMKQYLSSDKAYVPYMDVLADTTTESVQVVYFANRYVVVRVRRYGIIPFEIKQEFTTTGMSQAAIRQTDSIVL